MDRSARIAFLSEHASPVALRGGEDAGGQNVYVDEVSRNLARLGYRVDVFTRRDNADAPEIIEWAPGVRVINLTAGPAEFRLKDTLWQYMPAFRDAFLGFMEREKVGYDLIHSNFWMSGYCSILISDRRKKEGHSLVSPAASQQGIVYQENPKRSIDSTPRIPVVQIFHAMGKTKQRHQGSDDTSPSERIEVEYEVIRSVDRLIAQCPSEQAELIDDYGADPRKVVVIPSGVNTSVFRPVARDEARRHIAWETQGEIGLEPDDFVVAYVGRMIPRKDVRNVVRAVAVLARMARESRKRIVLLLVGGETKEPDPQATPEIGVLQQLAAELGISDLVRFIGMRQQDTLCYYYSAGDVVVTTPWYEPFGLTPLEGQACGRPVIGSAVGGITYTVVNGVTGFLVPPRDPETLAARLYTLMMEPDLSERMGRAARKRVEQEFTWPKVAERTAALYEALLAEWPSPQSALQGVGMAIEPFDSDFRGEPMPRA